MARKPKEETVEEKIVGNIEDAFSVLDDINPNATFLDENSLSTVTSWIDTGNYALNAIISGSLYGGYPSGRVTILTGPEACGKTLFVNKGIANAQKLGMYAAYFDTENALDESTATRLGADPKKIKHCPVEVTEDCRNQIVKFLNNIVEKNLQGKVIVVLDSIGNLITAQEKKKIEDGSDTPDMGNRAKACLCPETSIFTENGFKKLKDVEIGEKVLTHLGRFKEIEDKWDVKHEKFFIIKTEKSDIKLSPNHKLLVKRNDELLYIEAKNIKKTDKLVKILEQSI